MIKTSSRLLLLITAAVTTIAIECPAASAQINTIKVPPVPPEIQVPEGNTAFLRGHAIGTQNYICLPSGSGFSWTFLGPQATLFVTVPWIPGEIRQQIATHFLSPNPAEDRMPRATWQSSLDTSTVWAKSIASSTDPEYVDPHSIPWLLLETVGTLRGPNGGSMLSQTTFIHRLNTSGGVGPTGGCSESTNVGTTVFVPYKTDYFFYRSSRQK